MDEGLRERIASKISQRLSRAAIVQMLRRRGLSAEEAGRLYLEGLRERLPVTLHSAGKRHLVLGLVLLSVALALAAAVTWFYFKWSRQEATEESGRIWIFGFYALGALGWALGEIGYALSRFRLARNARQGRLSIEDVTSGPDARF